MAPAQKETVTIVTDGHTADGSPVLFPHLGLDDEEISIWLSECPLYNSDIYRWREIPKPSDVNMDSEPLRGAFDAIYTATVERFNQVPTTRRWLTKTRGLFMKSQRSTLFVDQDGCRAGKKRAPDFTILGAGPTCPGLPDSQPPKGYLNSISPIEVIREAALDFYEVEKNLYTFAWQCFSNQPNRLHVNSMLMTDQNVYLFLHDRHNTFRTRGYDIHSEASTFLRILLGLASDCADSIGFDPRVVYDEQDSISIVFGNNLLDARSSIDPPCKLDVVGLLPDRSHSLRGRGTVCWDVRMPSEPGRRLILKDYWRPCLCSPEWQIMKLLKGLPGVAQIVGYDDAPHTTISSLRARVIDDGSSINPKQDLIFTRILSEAYGYSLEHFDSPLHLLCAFRDAISGHSNMWRVGVLHRDVSVNNILHGVQDAVAGERGKIIDFDMATFVSENTKTITTGTRPFQSAMLLVSANKRHSQDHLDDLESFLYILLYICCKYDGPRNPMPGYPDIFDEFGCDDDARARSHRRRVLDGTTTMQSLVTPYFSNNSVILRLLDDLARFFDHIFKQKAKLGRQYAKNIAKTTQNDCRTRDEKILEALPTLQEIHKADLAADPIGKAHRAILTLVDSAIIGLEYMKEEESIQAAKKSRSSGEVESHKLAAPTCGAKRARSSLQDITNAAAKQKRLKGAEPAMKMQQDENENEKP